jgi:hypothetical protein
MADVVGSRRSKHRAEEDSRRREPSDPRPWDTCFQIAEALAEGLERKRSAEAIQGPPQPLGAMEPPAMMPRPHRRGCLIHPSRPAAAAARRSQSPAVHVGSPHSEHCPTPPGTNVCGSRPGRMLRAADTVARLRIIVGWSHVAARRRNREWFPWYRRGHQSRRPRGHRSRHRRPPLHADRVCSGVRCQEASSNGRGHPRPPQPPGAMEPVLPCQRGGSRCRDFPAQRGGL